MSADAEIGSVVSRHRRRWPGGSVEVRQPDRTDPAWRAMYDDRNRMVVAINFNRE
jgi:hypothetical protein